MRVFAIADPHLSRAAPKPMDVFGANWAGHPELFFERWQTTVKEDDLVLIPGDISWAMSLEDALLDLRDLAALPGIKVISRGNHDYWWPAIGKLRAALPPDMFALQNDALKVGPVVIAGTRGWTSPGAFEFTEQDEKIYVRELERLKLSLKAAAKLSGEKSVVMLHYPPTNARLESSPITDLLLEAAPDVVVYGHVHGESANAALPDLGTIEVHFVAADALNFWPKLLFEL